MRATLIGFFAGTVFSMSVVGITAWLAWPKIQAQLGFGYTSTNKTVTLQQDGILSQNGQMGTLHKGAQIQFRGVAHDTAVHQFNLRLIWKGNEKEAGTIFQKVADDSGGNAYISFEDHRKQ
ncbi:MAG: hypothetical protein P8Y36_09270 [Alphaproteobacteria bacterium]